MNKPDPKASYYAGYHEFVADNGDEYGSFEVFWYDGDVPEDLTKEEPMPAGWYWWACFPGCMPDGEPMGPFETSEKAWKDARKEW